MISRFFCVKARKSALTLISLVLDFTKVFSFQRTFRKSLFLHFSRLTGTIPGPVLFGYLIDKTCLLNGKLGNCLMYNNDDMAVNLTIVFVVFKILAVAFFALALFFSHRSHIPEEPADLQENDATNN